MESLKKRIEDKMVEYHRDYRRNKFISIYDLNSIFSEDCLRINLERDIEIFKLENSGATKNIGLESLRDYVTQSASRLYGILVLLGKSHLIVELYLEQPRISDTIFETIEKGYGPYCPENKLKGSNILRDISKDMFQEQWRIPPVFNRHTTFQYPAECFKHIQFPFMVLPDPARPHDSFGAFGQVYRTRVASGHLNSEGYNDGARIAFKSIRTDKGMEKEKLLREVKIVRDRSHRNIVTFFASLWAGSENPIENNEKVEYLHLFFEYASLGDLNHWIRAGETPKECLDEDSRHKYIYSSVLGIISGVAFIHREIDSLIGYHHDLKPKNILRFEGTEPTWKICDFGHGNTKHIDVSSGTERNERNAFGTYTYRPPEYEQHGVKHGRAFDIFSLGCILLEMAIILKFGWTAASISKFDKQRTDKKTKRPHNVRPAENFQENDGSYQCNLDVIEEWMNQMELGNRSERYQRFLDLIKEMIKPKSGHRVFSWEAEVDMHEICHRSSKEDLVKLLRNVVQKSDKSLNKLDDMHNPWKRANDKGKDWQLRILEENGWSYEDPEPSARPNGVGPYYSTLDKAELAETYEHNELFGRHDIDGKILRLFKPEKGYRTIGLYGLSGIGKSHIAYKYASRFNKSIDNRYSRHTFWVDAGNRDKYHESIRRIAKEIDIKDGSAKKNHSRVRSWLRDEKNEPWFMVFDGLEHDEVVRQVNKLLPQKQGHSLITTRNRQIICDLKLFNHIPKTGKRDENHVSVGEPSIDVLRSIFDCHNGEMLTNSDEMDSMLRSLFLPSLVKSTAARFKKFSIPTYRGYKDMIKNTVDRDQKRKPKDGDKNNTNIGCLQYFVSTKTAGTIVSDILCPISPNPPQKGCSPWPSHAFQLLGVMSCFNVRRIESKLVEKDFDDRYLENLREILGELKNHNYIEEQVYPERGSSILSMHGFIRAAVRQRIKETPGLGLKALLECHQTALASLCYQYNQRHKVPLENATPHFEPFVGFVRAYKDDMKAFKNFERHRNLTIATIRFSKLLLNRCRHGDVVVVLEFVNNLQGDKDNLEQLRSILAIAYMQYPLTIYFQDGWAKAEKLLHEVSTRYIDDTKTDDYQHQWQSRIELARLYSCTNRPNKAFGVLASFSQPRIWFPGRHLPLCWEILSKVKERSQQEGLAAVLTIELSRAYAVRANLRDQRQLLEKGKGKRGKPAWGRWDRLTSKKLLEEAEKNYERWVSDMEEDLVDIYILIGDDEALDTAKGKLEVILRRLKNSTAGSSGFERKLLKMETQVTRVELERDRPMGQKEEFVKYLGEIFDKYLKSTEDGWDDEYIQDCARVLSYGYEKTGMVDGRRDLSGFFLEKLHVQHWVDDDLHPMTIMPTSILVILLLVFVFIWSYFLSRPSWTREL